MGGIPQTGWGIPEALIQEIRQMGGIPESKKGDPPDGGDPRSLQESLQPRFVCMEFMINILAKGAIFVFKLEPGLDWGSEGPTLTSRRFGPKTQNQLFYNL